MFWKACQDYIKKFNTSKGKATAIALAKTIFASYIEDGAALQVNISSSAQTKIADDFANELIDVHIFGPFEGSARSTPATDETEPSPTLPPDVHHTTDS